MQNKTGKPGNETRVRGDDAYAEYPPNCHDSRIAKLGVSTYTEMGVYTDMGANSAHYGTCTLA